MAFKDHAFFVYAFLYLTASYELPVALPARNAPHPSQFTLRQTKGVIFYCGNAHWYADL